MNPACSSVPADTGPSTTRDPSIPTIPGTVAPSPAVLPDGPTPEDTEAAIRVVERDDGLGEAAKEGVMRDAYVWRDRYGTAVGVSLYYSFDPPVVLPSDRGEIVEKGSGDASQIVYGDDGLPVLRRVQEPVRFKNVHSAVIFVDVKRTRIFTVDAKNSDDLSELCNPIPEPR